MDRYKENRSSSFVTLFFCSLLLLFMFSAADRSGDFPSSSSKSDSQQILSSGTFTDHFPAVIAHPARIPELQKYAGCDFHGTGRNPASITDRQWGYNQSIYIHLTLAQKARLTFGTVRLLRSSFHIIPAGDDDVPVLG